MFDTLSVFPAAFWVVILVLITGIILSFKQMNDGSGVPMLAVIGTVAVWYVGDAFYNDYADTYATIFDAGVLQNAWWEVAWFLVVFIASAPYIHQRFNARYLRRQSGILQLVRGGINHPMLQRQLDVLFYMCLVIYAIIVAIAAIRIKGQMLYFFFPYLGYKPEVWGRQRIGSGFDALLSFTEYVQMMVTTIFGVLAAVSTNRRTRFLSMALCFVSWPYYLFDRARNVVLLIIIPAMLSWVFLRLRGGILKKIVALGCLFILVNGWMAFIIQNRSNQNIAAAFVQKGFNLQKESEVHHEGLNMFEELCWINTFIKNGTYDPNWGARYWAELVNPIPRTLWHNKPLIGIDYAIARGQGMRNSGNSSGNDAAGVYATIATGMIGQGVVNFGRLLGPVVAALLMGFWVALLARQDLNIWKLGRLPLYACGVILTFNLGRDITFITLYPFVFGAIAFWWLDRYQTQNLSQPALNKANQNQPDSRMRPGPSPARRPPRRRRMIMRHNARFNGSRPS